MNLENKAQSESASAVAPTVPDTSNPSPAHAAPAPREASQALADAQGTSYQQQLLALVGAENKTAAAKLILKMMEEARAQGAPPPRPRGGSVFGERARFKAGADARDGKTTAPTAGDGLAPAPVSSSDKKAEGPSGVGAFRGSRRDNRGPRRAFGS